MTPHDVELSMLTLAAILAVVALIVGVVHEFFTDPSGGSHERF